MIYFHVEDMRRYGLILFFIGCFCWTVFEVYHELKKAGKQVGHD